MPPAMLPSGLMMRWIKNSRRACLGALVLWLVAGASAAQRELPSGSERSPALRQAISDAAKKYKIPGIAAALIDHGQLRAIEVFGVRDQKSNSPVTANTRFEAGSLGEPLYAYAVLLLSAGGNFNPGAPLPSYLPLPYLRDLDPTSSSPATEPLYDPLFNQVTAIRVMNHTTGLPDWVRNRHLRWQLRPSEKWSYSNEGYVYLQHVVEHVTGEPFEAFVQRSVISPARMAHSTFVWRESDAGDLATGYDASGAPVEIHHYVRPAAATTLSTSIRDYEQFMRYLLASAPAQRAHESAVSLMLNPTVTVDAATSFSWGLGVALEKNGDDLFFVQRGGSSGFASFVIASRKSGSGLVIFTNSANGFDAVPDIVAATLGGNHPILKSALSHPR